MDISDLSPEELRKLRGQIDFLLGDSETVSKTPTDRWTSLVHGLVSQEFSDRHQRFPGLKALTSNPKWKEGVVLLDEYLGTVFQVKTQAEKSKLVRFLVKLLLEWMDGVGIVLGPTPFLNNFGKIPGLVDAQFPGYRQSGLLPQVVALV